MELWELAQAESPRDAAEQVALSAGGGAAFALRVLKLLDDLEDQSRIDQITKAAVFAFCERAG